MKIDLENLTVEKAREILRLAIDTYNDEQSFNQFYNTVGRSSEQYSRFISSMERIVQSKEIDDAPEALE